jgi:transcriptional regulator with GAF, ATPase, and Fis domain
MGSAPLRPSSGSTPDSGCDTFWARATQRFWQGSQAGLNRFGDHSRLGALLAALGVVSYSIAVLVAVARTEDIGLRCIFGREIREVGRSFIWARQPREVAPALRAERTGRDAWSPEPPREGDMLLAIGARSIEDYRDYVRALREIRGRNGQRVDVRWRAADGTTRLGQVTIAWPAGWAYAGSIAWFLQEMLVFAVGWRVYWRRPRDEASRLFFWLCVATVGAFMGGYHWSRIVVYRPLIFLFAAFAVFVPILSLHFYLVFPRPNPFFEAHRRRIQWALYALPLLSLMGLWTAMGWSMWDPDKGDIQTSLYVLRNMSLGYVAISVAIFVGCLSCLISSFRHAASRAERNQVQWILLATLASFLPIAYLLWDTWSAPWRLGMAVSAWPMTVVSLLYTAAYAISITRYKLLQAEEFLNRSVLYFLVTLGVGLLYSGLLVAGSLVLRDSLQGHLTGLGLVVLGLTTFVTLVVWEIVRQRFQKAIDRRFFKEKYKFDLAMRKMSVAVDRLVDRSTLGRRLLEAAAEVLRLEWGAIYVTDAPLARLSLAACSGPEPDERVLDAENPLVGRLRTRATIRVPHALAAASDPALDALIALGGEAAAALEAEGTLAGVLILGPKRNGMPYEDEEMSFVAALSSVATLALRSTAIQTTLEHLNEELRDKVEKIAEQQRRILILQDQLARRSPPSADGVEASSAHAASLPDPGVFAPIKGSSRAVRTMLDYARKVAASPATVLILGESGTGKELLAEAIHAASPRASRKFVKVHCAALSQNLLESELFGHVKGAFTDALRDRVGRFQEADGGTLFLDEIGDINWEVQTKLLRVLQERSFERVGSSQPISVDVRILAATHQNLEALIRAGRFREDLFYRLNVFSIRTPALRERKDDIFELAVHFLSEHARRVGKSVSHLDEGAVEALLAYDWPGNIRELENVIERAVILAEGPAVTRDDLLADPVRRPTGRRRSRLTVPATGAARPRSPSRPIATEADALDDGDDPEFLEYERQRLLDALETARQNKSEAARLLDMPRSTFFSKLKKHGLA